MDRRSFLKATASAGALTTIGGVIPLVPLVADAQQPAKVARIGFMTRAAPTAPATRMEEFRRGMRELGYVEGQHFILSEARYAPGKNELLPELIADLVRTGVRCDRCRSGRFNAGSQKDHQPCPHHHDT
jgi:TAT (twin-arginine translocation) pathway-exported protein